MASRIQLCSSTFRLSMIAALAIVLPAVCTYAFPTPSSAAVTPQAQFIASAALFNASAAQNIDSAAQFNASAAQNIDLEALTSEPNELFLETDEDEEMDFAAADFVLSSEGTDESPEMEESNGLRRRKRSIPALIQVFEPFTRLNYVRIIRRWACYNLVGNFLTSLYGTFKENYDMIYTRNLRQLLKEKIIANQQAEEEARNTAAQLNTSPQSISYQTWPPQKNFQGQIKKHGEPQPVHQMVMQRHQQANNNYPAQQIISNNALGSTPQFQRVETNTIANFLPFPSKSALLQQNYYQKANIRPEQVESGKIVVHAVKMPRNFEYSYQQAGGRTNLQSQNDASRRESQRHLESQPRSESLLQSWWRSLFG